MVYTITINPALDYYMSFNNKISNHQSTNNIKYFPGGKGVNASKILNNFGVKNIAITVAGGLNGQKFVDLAKKEKINIQNIEINNELRINIKSNFINSTYEQNFLGEKVLPQQINQQILKKLKNINSNDWILIMGSYPPGYNYKFLEKIVIFIKNKKSKIIFDIPNSSLMHLLKYEPEFIKPNKKELEELFNIKIKNMNDIKKYSQKLLELGAKRVIVSLDKSGAIYKDNKHTFIISSPKINEVNSSGAGDSMVAVFAYSLINNLDIKESLKLSAGAGVASAATNWIANNEQIKNYQKQIKLKEVE